MQASITPCSHSAATSKSTCSTLEVPTDTTYTAASQVPSPQTSAHCIGASSPHIDTMSAVPGNDTSLGLIQVIK